MPDAAGEGAEVERTGILHASVPAGARLADIGSDHCYLPVALMCRGVITVVAGEVALTPFHATERTMRESELE